LKKVSMDDFLGTYRMQFTSCDTFGIVINMIVLYDLDGIQAYLMSDHSGQQIVILTTTLWWQRLGKDWK
jgi:hypothetical protein